MDTGLDINRILTQASRIEPVIRGKLKSAQTIVDTHFSPELDIEENMWLNLKLVKKIAKGYENENHNLDDLFSTGVMGLLKAIPTFDPGQNVKFASYAGECIHNEIRLSLRQDKKCIKDVPLSEEISTDKEGETLTLEDVIGTEPDMVENAAEDKVLLKEVFNALPTIDRRYSAVLMLKFFYYYSNKDIAKKFGISPSYTSRLIKRSIISLRNAVEQNMSKHK